MGGRGQGSTQCPLAFHRNQLGLALGQGEQPCPGFRQAEARQTGEQRHLAAGIQGVLAEAQQIEPNSRSCRLPMACTKAWDWSGLAVSARMCFSCEAGLALRCMNVTSSA